MVAVKQELYDPMVYDVMVEQATRLEGEYLFLERQASDPAEKAQWRAAHMDVLAKERAVDPTDEGAVRAAGFEFSRRLDELERLRVAAG